MPESSAPGPQPEPARAPQVRACWHVLTPLLFAWFPLLLLYAQNAAKTYFDELRVPLFVVSALTLVLLTVLFRFTRDHRHAAFLLAVGWFYFFNYTRVFVHINSDVLPGAWPIVPHYLFLPAYASYALITLWLCARLRAARLVLARYALALGLCLNLLVGLDLAGNRQPAGSAEPLMPAPQLNAAPDRPDIYLLVLDAYARADVLAREFNYDNTPFLAALRQRGFTIFDRALTNYSYTEYAMLAMLNFSYLPVATPDTPVIPGNWLGDNAVLNTLRPLGYRSIAFPSEMEWTELRTADHHLPGSRLILTPYQNAVINLTPFLLIESRLPFNQSTLHAQHLQQTLATFPDAAELAAPAFVYAHLLAPHPPFVFAADGTRRQAPGPFSLDDGNLFPGTRDEYNAGYRGQLHWLNRELLRQVDRIQRTRGRKSVIILTADHGSRRGYHFNDLAATDVRECFPIFCAVYVPPPYHAAWPADMSSVNLFRGLFNILFNADLPLLPNRHYYAPISKRWQFTEISAAAIAGDQG